MVARLIMMIIFFVVPQAFAGKSSQIALVMSPAGPADACPGASGVQPLTVPSLINAPLSQDPPFRGLSLDVVWQMATDSVLSKWERAAAKLWWLKSLTSQEPLLREEIIRWLMRIQEAPFDPKTKRFFTLQFLLNLGISQSILPYDLSEILTNGGGMSESDFWRMMLQNDISVFGQSLNLGRHFSLRPQMDENDVTIGFFITPQGADAPTLFLKTLKERGRDEARHLHWVKLWFEGMLNIKQSKPDDPPIAKVILPLEIFSYEARGASCYAALFPVAPGESLSFYRALYFGDRATEFDCDRAKTAFFQAGAQLRRFHEVFAVPHGDAHEGNLFYVEDSVGPGQIVMIDVETFVWRLLDQKLSDATKKRRGKYAPRGDVLDDAVFFLSGSYFNRQTLFKTKELYDQFIQGYLSAIANESERTDIRGVLNESLQKSLTSK